MSRRLYDARFAAQEAREAENAGVVPEGWTELDAVGAAVGVGVGAVSSVGGGPSNVPITFGSFPPVGAGGETASAVASVEPPGRVAGVVAKADADSPKREPVLEKPVMLDERRTDGGAGAPVGAGVGEPGVGANVGPMAGGSCAAPGGVVLDVPVGAGAVDPVSPINKV